MKPQVVSGAVIAIALLAGVWFVPRVAGPGTAGLSAHAKAREALVSLERYDVGLGRATLLGEDEAIAATDADQLDTLLAFPIFGADGEPVSISEYVAALNQQIQKTEKRVRAVDTDAGLDGSPIPPLQADAARLKGTAQQFATFSRDNADRLDAAAALARDAGTNNVGTGHAAGIIDYVRAAESLAEASELRTQMQEIQSQLLQSAVDWKNQQNRLDQARGYDSAGVTADIEERRTEKQAMLAETNQEIESLEAVIREREAGLANLATALAGAKSALVQLEERGFQPGNDSSFSTYQREYREIAARLKELHHQEHALREGYRLGDNRGTEDASAVTVDGNVLIPGLDEVRERLQAAQARSAALTGYLDSDRSALETVRETDDRNQAVMDEIRKRIAALEQAQDGLTSRLGELAEAAFKVEDRAINAATKASNAYQQAASAAQRWRSRASQMRSQFDSAGKNDRLKRIANEPYFEAYAVASQAAAQVLLGRVHLLRVEAIESLLGVTDVLSGIRTDFQFERTPFAAALDTAREEGRTALDSARQRFEEDLVSKLPAAVQWVPQSSAAGVYQLLARIDQEQAGAMRSRAIELMNTALTGREKSPLLRPLVAFQQHFSGVESAPAAPGAGEQPSGDDLFDDDKDDDLFGEGG